jgi:hypothetical protein
MTRPDIDKVKGTVVSLLPDEKHRLLDGEKDKRNSLDKSELWQWDDGEWS